MKLAEFNALAVREANYIFFYLLSAFKIEKAT